MTVTLGDSDFWIPSWYWLGSITPARPSSGPCTQLQAWCKTWLVSRPKPGSMDNRQADTQFHHCIVHTHEACPSCCCRCIVLTLHSWPWHSMPVVHVPQSFTAGVLCDLSYSSNNLNGLEGRFQVKDKVLPSAKCVLLSHASHKWSCPCVLLHTVLSSWTGSMWLDCGSHNPWELTYYICFQLYSDIQ